MFRCMFQKQKCTRRHRFCDVTKMPFAALPDRSKILRFLSWVVTQARSKLVEFDIDRRCKLCRGGFGKNSNAAVIVCVCTRRRPRVLIRVGSNPRSPLCPHTCSYIV